MGMGRCWGVFGGGGCVIITVALYGLLVGERLFVHLFVVVLAALPHLK